MVRIGKGWVAGAIIALTSAGAHATVVGIYADSGTNPVASYLQSAGYTVSYLTDSDIAAGALASLDVFFYTRASLGFGAALSSDASLAAKKAVKGGNAVLFLNDITDVLASPAMSGHLTAGQLIRNAVEFAATSEGVGFVGEFAGAGWALDQGLIGGSSHGWEAVASYNNQANVQTKHPVMQGIGSTFNYSDGFDYLWKNQDIHEANVLARAQNGKVVIAATALVPEPASALTLLGLAAIAVRRRKRQA